MKIQSLATVAEAVVSESVRISRTIQERACRHGSILKEDQSPVTLADFTVQALICNELRRLTPTIPVVAEETSLALRSEPGGRSVQSILSILKEEGHGAHFQSPSDLFQAIDWGAGTPGAMFWTLDPIDGTKGFIRGEQYAVALALIADGRVELALIGCPRLQIEGDPSRLGYLFTALRESPASRHNLETGQIAPLQVSAKNQASEMRFVQSYESAHGHLRLQHRMAEELGIRSAPVQMDSQVKYCVVASGEAEIYVRIPNPSRLSYREKIWDHAAGALLLERAGGVVSDILGQSLDFGQGKTLSQNRGIVAAVPQVHDEIVSMVRRYQEISAIYP